MPASPQFFISYDKTYRNEAARLHERLQAELQGKFNRDIEVFIDAEGIRTGDEWLQQIEDALASLTVLIVLVNDGLVSREYCRLEFNRVKERIDKGEACMILPVRFQNDSEVYRSQKGRPPSHVRADDEAYLATLKPEERDLVIELRKLQAIDGVALRDNDPSSWEYRAAFRALAEAAAGSYRRLSRAAILSPAAEKEEARQARAPMQRRAGAAGAVAVVALAAALEFVVPGTKGSLRGLLSGKPAEPPEVVEPVEPPKPSEEVPPEPEVETVVWEPVSGRLENRSGKEVFSYLAVGRDADIAEPISDGGVRPLGAESGVESAEIDGELWYRYPTLSGSLAYVPASSIRAPK
jgi:hypothetical protein